MLTPQVTTEKLKAKDDFQVMLVILLIAFITFVKVYTVYVNDIPAQQPPVANYSLKNIDLHLSEYQQNLHIIK